MDDEDFAITIPPYVSPAKTLSKKLKKLSQEDKKFLDDTNIYKNLKLLPLPEISYRTTFQKMQNSIPQDVILIVYHETVVPVRILSWATTQRHLLRFLRDYFNFSSAENLILKDRNRNVYTYSQTIPHIFSEQMSNKILYLSVYEKDISQEISINENFIITIDIKLERYPKGCRVHWMTSSHKTIYQIISDLLEGLDRYEYHEFSISDVDLIYNDEVLDGNKFLGEYPELGSAFIISNKDISKRSGLELCIIKGYDIFYRTEKSSIKDAVLTLTKKKSNHIEKQEKICPLCEHPLSRYFTILPGCRHYCDIHCLKMLCEEDYRCPVCLMI
jgi:hypothetical protein